MRSFKIGDDWCNLFLRDLERRLSTIENAIACLERDPNDTRSVQRIRAELHDIKGTGAPFGVPAATALARELEDYLSSTERMRNRDLQRLWRGITDFRDILGRYRPRSTS